MPGELRYDLCKSFDDFPTDEKTTHELFPYNEKRSKRS
jgi:hypothetical protein